MTITIRRISVLVCMGWMLILGLLTSTVQAAPMSMNYGNQPALTVVYQDVTESSSDPNFPLYGAPSTVGDSLVFNPPNFFAQALNGGNDFTDGTLTTLIVANTGNFIDKLAISEFGDYTLLAKAGGTAATFASISAPVFLSIEAVNGADLKAPLKVNGNVAFDNGGTWQLPTDAGSGVIWKGAGTFDITKALAGAGIAGKATRVRWTMDNALYAQSQGNGYTAFIKKKDIGGVTITVVPEPSTFLLASIGLCSWWLWMRRRGLIR